MMLFFVRKWDFQLNISTKKDTPNDKTVISPVWEKILKIWGSIFEPIQIEVQCRENYFKIFLPQEAGAFGNNIEKEPQKPCSKLKKYVYYIFTENICSAFSLMQVVSFLQKCINFIEQRLKFSHFECSIIP